MYFPGLGSLLYVSCPNQEGQTGDRPGPLGDLLVLVFTVEGAALNSL